MYCRGARSFQRSDSGSYFMGEYARSLFQVLFPARGLRHCRVVLGTAVILSLQVTAKQARGARVMVTAILT